MKTTPSPVLVGAFALALSFGLAACKKGKDAETPAEVEPTRPPSPSGTMSLRGYYSHVGTVGSFQDCTTGQQWRVSSEGDNVALEEAYLASEVPLGSAVLVTVEGGIDRRPNPNGGDQTMLIVARYVKSWPGVFCPGDGPDAE